MTAFAERLQGSRAAKRIREDFAERAARRVLLDAVDAYHIDLQQMLAGKKTKRVTQVRHAALWLARRVSQASYPVLGQVFGGLHHATVMAAVRKVDSLVSVREPATMRALKRIIAHAERKVRR